MVDLNFLKHLLTSFLFLIVMNSTTFGVAQSNKPFITSLETCNLTTYSNTLDHLINPNDTYGSGVLYNLSIQVAKRELLIAFTNFDKNVMVHHSFGNMKAKRVQLALQSCRRILDLALYYLHWAIPTNGTNDLAKPETRENFRTWISSVGSLLETCKDEFDYTPDGVKEAVVELLENSTKTISNTLDIMYQIITHSNETHSLDMEKTSSYKFTSDWSPTWLSDKVANGPDLVVAADGSGNYKTITEALHIVPPKSDKRFIIYVKKGFYFEHVVVHKNKWNVLIYGDGMDDTIVSGNHNRAAGVPTFRTATLSVFGKGFMVEYMAFQNTAGPKRHQAVAVLSTADQSSFFRCRIDGYQDTLYAHSMNQFYRECKIYGTIDFIFGAASVVIQSSYILVKRPLPGQKNIITAQGKKFPWSNSAISIQKCRLIPAEDLTGVKTYLGRPWKDYSTTIIMQSFLGNVIHPQGWLNWLPGVIPPNTIYYAEYMNIGPGANTENRINWIGVKRNVSPGEASRFTVRSLLRGDEWIPGKGVPFRPDF